MNAGQYEGLMTRLGEILDRMPERPGTVAPDSGRTGAATALTTLLSMLDGWIEGVRDNHVGLGHRGENRGEECWTQFHPTDIRRMVNDVARELGLAEFPEPKTPEEDKVR